MIPDAVREELRLPEVGQVGYVVADIGKTIAYCKDTFGIGPWMLLDERPSPCIQKGLEVNPLLRIGLAYAGRVQIELIQVLEGESMHLSHLERPEAEVHHLGFVVRDIDRRLDECQRIGVDTLQRGTIRDSGFTVDYAYLDTVDRAGIILELIQWRLGPIPAPVSRSVHNFVCWAGSRTLFRGRIIK